MLVCGHGECAAPEACRRARYRLSAWDDARAAAYLAATRDTVGAAVDGLRVLALHEAQTAAVRSAVERKLDLLGGGIE